MNSLPVLESGEKVFSPRPKAGRIPRFGLYLFLFFALIALVSPFLPGEEGTSINYLMILAIPVFLGFAFLFYRLHRSARMSYGVTREGIREMREGGARLRWEDVQDIMLVHPMGGAGELMVQLLDRSGRKAMTVYTEHFARGGRTFVSELQRHLGPLFEKKAREYLSGQQRFGQAFIKDVIRIEGNLIFIEFPKLKKQTIPMETIRRVEWLPGPISGAKLGYVLIEHAEGRIELPQNIKGIQYFLYALKYLYGLGDRVNPEYAEDLTSRIDEAQTSQTAINFFRILGIALIGLGIFFFSRELMELLDENAIDRMGIKAEALIAMKRAPNVLHLRFKDKYGKDVETRVYVEKDLYTRVSEKEILPIKYHPAAPKKVLFQGKRAMGLRFHLGLMSISFLFVVAGIILTLVAYFKKRKSEEILKSLEMEKGRTVESVPPISLSIPSGTGPPMPEQRPAVAIPSGGSMQQPANLPVAPVPGAGPQAKSCSRCQASITGDYFLSAGVVFCPVCREKAGEARMRPGCLTLLRAGSYGAVGAILASGLWALVTILTGYELGIIAILVGLIVGYAVRLGSGKAQGRIFQFLALALAFFSLAYAMIPIVVTEISKNPEMRKTISDAWQQATKNSAVDKGQTGGESAEDFEEYGEDVLSTGTLAKATTVQEESGKTPREKRPDRPETEPGARVPSSFGLMKVLKAVAFIFIGAFLLIVILLVSPIVIYIIMLFSSPLSFIFLAIALWEAWRLNRPEKLVFLGPFNDTMTIDFTKADISRP